MIAYVRRGPRPVRNVFIQSEDGTVAATKQGRRKPQGVIAAYRGQDGTVRIGWSLCRKGETYDNKVGLRYALERAIPLDVVREMLEELTVRQLVPESTFEGECADAILYKGTTSYSYPPQSVRKTLSMFIKKFEKL